MIGATYFFFFSLFGLVVLFSLKLIELKRGAMLFRVLRYKLDLIVRQYTGKLVSYLRFINWTTIRLLFLFLLQQGIVLLVRFWKFVANSSVSVSIKQNLGIVPNEREGGVSPFLKEIAPKIEKKEEVPLS